MAGSVLTRAQKEEKLEELRRLVEKQEREVEKLRETDPFWFYEPSDREITEEGHEILREFLKPDDIPSEMTCQRDIHASTAPIYAASGGNQSGKTTVGAIEAFIHITGEIPHSMKSWYPKEKLPKKRPFHVRVITQDYRNGFLLNVLPTYRYWAPREFLKNGKFKDSYSSEMRVLTLQRGGVVFGTVEFMSNEQDVEAFQGPPRHMMIYDEEPRLDIYKENLMRFTTAEQLRILFCLTPTGGLTWLADFAMQAEDGAGHTVDWFLLPSVTNKRANLTVLKSILGSMGTYEEIRMRLLGEFVSLSGLVYGRMFNLKSHLIEPFDFKCSCGRKPHAMSCPASQYLVLRGVDPHLVKPTAVVWVALDREGICYVVDCMFEDAETDTVKKEIKARSEGMRTGWTAIDRSADSDVRAFDGRNIYKELTRGENALGSCRKSEKFEGSIKAGVDTIKRYLKPNEKTGKPMLYFFRTPNVKPLVDSMRTLERDTHANEEVKGPKDKIREGKHDLHAAMRYIFQYPLRWYPEVDEVPQPQYQDEAVCW